MKGVVLAGGSGTRLRPMTRVINKHVIPIYDKPMIYYPVTTLIRSGIDDILVISGADHIGKYIQLLENEEDLDAEFSYKVQTEPKGIAHAVSVAEDFVDDEFAVILGDNILLEDLSDEIRPLRGDERARIFLHRVDQPPAYGIASLDDGEIVGLEEKPQDPDSDTAVIGLYVYDSSVFDVIRTLEPSDRGEYEITDVNKRYLSEDALDYRIIEGSWFDAGTPEGVFRASEQVRDARE
jgi:glucose-1-phosphate thymidylyltransferase